MFDCLYICTYAERKWVITLVMPRAQNKKHNRSRANHLQWNNTLSSTTIYNGLLPCNAQKQKYHEIVFSHLLAQWIKRFYFQIWIQSTRYFMTFLLLANTSKKSIKGRSKKWYILGLWPKLVVDMRTFFVNFCQKGQFLKAKNTQFGQKRPSTGWSNKTVNCNISLTE